MGIGDWGLGIGDWGLGIGAKHPNPKHNTQILVSFFKNIKKNK